MKPQLPAPGLNQQEGLVPLIHEIVRIADPEKILLLSAGYDYLLTENIFSKNPIQTFHGNRYNLLILSKGKEKKSLATLEMVLMSLLNDRRNLQLCIMDIDEFNVQAEAGDEYLEYILLNAMIWYDKGRIPLATPKANAG